MADTHQHDQHLLDRSSPERFLASRRVTFVSLSTNLLLAIAQAIIGVIGHSQALVADAVHTLSDMITDVLVLFALFHSRKAADEQHPYGHGRIETAVTMILGILLLLVGIGIAVQAGWRLATAEEYVIPDWSTFWVAVITLIAKEGLYRYTIRTARRFGSDMLRANAWHHRSDAVSSLVVVLGIAGSLVGFAYLDAVAAIVIAVMIGKIGVELAWKALQELIDTGLSPARLAEIRRLIESVSGVRDLHLLRTRRIGGEALVDVHVLVDKRLSVTEGHQISETVRGLLIREVPEVADVMVHIDTEEDIEGPSCIGLPLRKKVLSRLEERFRDIPEASAVQRTTLHYVNGKLEIELLLPFSAAPTAEAARTLAARFREALSEEKEVRRVDVLFS